MSPNRFHLIKLSLCDKFRISLVPRGGAIVLCDRRREPEPAQMPHSLALKARAGAEAHWAALPVLSLARCWASMAAVTRAVGSVGDTRERKEVESM